MTFNFYDWDDTLVLSRQAIFLSYQRAIAETADHKLDWDEYNTSLYHNANAYLAELGCDNLAIKKIKDLKNLYYTTEYWKEIKILRKEFPKDETHLIITNTSSKVVENLLSKLEMPDVFTHIIGSDIYEGVNRKPAPDLYNFAFSKFRNKFNSEKDEVIIYEDTDWGMNAGISFYEEHKSRIKNFMLIYHPLFLSGGNSDEN